jgi:hypothetical protein
MWDHHSSAVGSSLIFSDESAPELVKIVRPLRSIVSQQRVGHLSFVWEASDKLLINADIVELAIARSSSPFSLPEPKASSRTKRVLLHNASINGSRLNIVVTDRLGSPATLSAARKTALCEEVTRLLVSHTAPAAVLWEPDCTISTAEEVVDAARDHVPASTSPLDVARSDAQVRPVCSAWERVSRGYSPEPMEDALAISGRSLSDENARARRNIALYLLLIAISGPAAVGALFFRMFHEWNTYRLAQLVIIAGLFTALELASIWSLGDVLFGRV